MRQASDGDSGTRLLPSLTPVAAALRRAATLRNAALVPSETAEQPADWDADEDGDWGSLRPSESQYVALS